MMYDEERIYGDINHVIFSGRIVTDINQTQRGLYSNQTFCLRVQGRLNPRAKRVYTLQIIVNTLNGKELKRGDKVLVYGRLLEFKVKDKEDKTVKSTISITADRIVLLEDYDAFKSTTGKKEEVVAADVSFLDKY